MALCPNCFREKNTAGACPFCGFDPRGQWEKYPLALRPGTILYGRYIVGRVLGQGGFGITYVARDYLTGERVAVKEYLPMEFAGRNADGTSVLVYSGDRAENFTYGRGQFLAEAKTLAEFVGDEHIVRIHGFFEENGTAYFVMDYVDGPSLNRYMKEKGRLSTAEAAALLLPLMKSLGKVHARGIVHRDIAPDNILIERGKGAKLIDFGAARYSTGEKSQSLDVVLKHGFAPYEQYMRRGRQGPWTDVYALAATFYYAITGKIPPESIERRDNDTLLPAARYGANISREADAVLQKALSVLSNDRYSSMEEFHREMTAALAAKPIDRRMPGAKRLPMILAAAAVAVVLIILGVFGLRGKKSPVVMPEPRTEAQASASSVTEPPFSTKAPVAAPENGIGTPGAVSAEALTRYRELFSGTAVGDTVRFGRYNQDNDTTNGLEDIEWQVLDRDGDSILIVSTYALDCRRYHTETMGMTWENCSLRIWLNHSFLREAFSLEEQAMIPTVTVPADKNFSNGTSTGNDTEDQVFLLSVAEADKYFSSDKDRLCTATAYAKAQGCKANSYGICSWWLRTTGIYSNCAAFTNSDGPVDKAGTYIDTSNIAVRPALWISFGMDDSEYVETLAELYALYGGEEEETVEISAEDTRAYYRDMLADVGAGDLLVFGSYEQDDNPSNGREDLEWQVLERDGDRLFVISRYVLDYQQYHSERAPATWETCSLRRWLNTSFLDTAFTAGEQTMIPAVTVHTGKHFSGGASAGNDTEDQVFVLSISEVSNRFTHPEDRICLTTAYTASKAGSGGQAGVKWWTRTPGTTGDLVMYVDTDGITGLVYEADKRAGVRPVLWIDLSA